MQWFLLAALEVAAIYCAWTAVTSSRTSQGSIGWVIFLLAAPYVAVPAYLFLGHHRFKGYVVSRRASARVASAIKTHRAENSPEGTLEIDPTPFEAISDLPVVRGNDIELLVDGPASFEAMFTAIDAADRYILVQFYIVRDDTLGQAFKDRLIGAAGRGVEIRFLFDPVGSYGLPSRYLAELRDAGVKLVEPSQTRGPKNRFQINFRNHRKTLIVDGEIGFTGGLNIGDEYMGRDPKLGHWRDTHVALRGPVVTQLQLVFAEDWHWATNETSFDILSWRAPQAPADKPAMIVPTGPADALETGQLFFFAAISAARKRVWISSPYFVPDTDIVTALKHAAIRGVEVRLLLPERIDHYVPWLAAHAYFDELREVGVQIWRFTDGFLHQKAILADDALMGVGTSNLDNRSFRLNFETMALFFDKGAARALEDLLVRDFKQAFRLETPLKQRHVVLRIGAPIARLFSPLL